MRRIGWAGLLLAAALLTAASVTADQPAGQVPVGAVELGRLDLLPRFRRAVKVGMVSSYDRTGGNDDGFSGRHSFLRKEGDALVIADLKGPGCVYRMWTPTPTDDPLEFYFDGEAAPRLTIPFRKLFDGTRPPFTAPISGYGAGGFWTYHPLPYRQSLKVVVRAPRVQFYQINYATYSPQEGVESYRPGQPMPSLDRAAEALSATGTDLTRFVAPEGAQTKTARVRGSLSAGKPLTLYSSRKGGRILGLKIRPASALAGKDRAVLLRAYWDGAREPAILSPAGDFFGFSWGEPAARSLLLGTEGDTCYAWFPMPFDRSARLELVSERAGEVVPIEAEVITSDLRRQPDEGRFYALWRRENPTTQGQPHTFIETAGRGHLVGAALQAQGAQSGGTLFFEGDDQTTLDGELTHHGTGSEDFFNGGWYDVPGRWDTRISFPLNGCLDYKKHLGRTGAYRLFVTDALSFQKSLKLTIEHAPEKNAMVTDYASVAYLYLQDPPARPWSIPQLSERAVKDPTRLVFTPGWSVPIQAFSFQNGTLTKKNERIGNADVRYLSVRAQGDDVFGQHLVALQCEVPERGRYKVSIEAVRGPEGGQVQLFQDEKAVGEAVDLYAAQRAKSELIPVGTLSLDAGPAPVFLKLVGKNPAATAMGLDLVTIVLERG